MCRLCTVYFGKEVKYCRGIIYVYSSIFTILKLLHAHIWKKRHVRCTELCVLKSEMITR